MRESLQTPNDVLSGEIESETAKKKISMLTIVDVENPSTVFRC